LNPVFLLRLIAAGFFAAGPIVAGLLLARLDYLPAFWIMGSLLLLSTPIFLLTVTHEGRVEPPEAPKLV
jgi:hypothetical protein